MTLRRSGLTTALIALCTAPLLVTACSRAARSASEIGPPAAREAGEPLARGAGEAGEQSVSRAAVQAEARQIAAPYTRAAIEAACRLKDSYELLTADDFEDRAGAIAGLANVAQVRALIDDFQEAQSSGEKVRVYAVAAICHAPNLAQ